MNRLSLLTYCQGVLPWQYVLLIGAEDQVVKTMRRVRLLSTAISSSNWFSDSSIWLLAISSSLFAIYMNLIASANDGSLMGTSLLYWIAIGSIVWSKRESLYLESGILGTVLGTLVLTLVLLKSTFIEEYDPFLRVAPFLSALGLGLLASGLRGLKQYWKELTIFAFLVPPPSLLSTAIDFSPITARFSTALLWYSGFDVIRRENFIFIPDGGVEVYSGCSGVDIMLHLLGLSLIFISMFPTSNAQRVSLPIISLLIAFFANGIRVAIMALLSEPRNEKLFEYWHKGEGSLIFSMLAVVLLGIYCFFTLKKDDAVGDDWEWMEEE